MTRRKRTLFPLFVLVFSLFFTSCGQISGDSRYSDFGRNSETQELRKEAEETESIVAVLPEYSGEPYTIVITTSRIFQMKSFRTIPTKYIALSII